jgi:hypothetical protein
MVKKIRRKYVFLCNDHAFMRRVPFEGNAIGNLFLE